jgi:hypothetical protein
MVSLPLGDCFLANTLGGGVTKKNSPTWIDNLCGTVFSILLGREIVYCEHDNFSMGGVF